MSSLASIHEILRRKIERRNEDSGVENTPTWRASFPIVKREIETEEDRVLSSSIGGGGLDCLLGYGASHSVGPSSCSTSLEIKHEVQLDVNHSALQCVVDDDHPTDIKHSALQDVKHSIPNSSPETNQPISPNEKPLPLIKQEQDAFNEYDKDSSETIRKKVIDSSFLNHQNVGLSDVIIKEESQLDVDESTDDESAMRNESTTQPESHSTHDSNQANPNNNTCRFCQFNTKRRAGAPLKKCTHPSERPLKTRMGPYPAGGATSLKLQAARLSEDKMLKKSRRFCPLTARWKFEYDYTQDEKGFVEIVKIEKEKKKVILPEKFHCDVCDFSTRWLQSLKCHQSIHRGDKPFRCSLCKFSTRWKSSLKEHEFLHMRNAKTVKFSFKG